MRFRVVLSLTTLFLACFTLAVFSQPLSSTESGHAMKGTMEDQSVTGTIASLGDAAFELSVAEKNQKAQRVQFLVDNKTKVDGKLTIGAQAMVEYRSDSGKNIAVHVVVTPSSGIQE
ncbi:MAG: hypothetical protein ACRD51_14840 [Candidatus Acidiferrum sp.]